MLSGHLLLLDIVSILLPYFLLTFLSCLMPCNLLEDREFSLFKFAFLSAGTLAVSVHVEGMIEVDVKKLL